MAAKNALVCEGDQRFFCSNGDIYSSPQELYEGLKTMDEDTFTYHSNISKSDFASWIREVFKKKRIANKMHHRRGCRSEIIDCVSELL